jgi:ketosteroid isomerase-like protein
VSNLKTVQDLYAAFAAGDVPAILAKLAPDVDWEYSGDVAEVPWLQARRGRDAVGGFFEALGALELDKFVVKEILDGGDVVVALVDLEGKVRANGKPVAEEDEIHLFRFNAAGEIARFRHGVNTHRSYLAYTS